MGWLGRVVRRQMGMEGLERDAAQVAARVNILARADDDRRRTQRSGEDAPAPVARWRWTGAAWERWSFIEEGFVADDPPQTLLDHVATGDGPEEGDTLRLVDGTWQPERSGPATDAGPLDEPVPGADPTRGDDDRDEPSSGPGTGAAAPADDPARVEPEDGAPPAGGRRPDDVAAQLEAWRRRNR